MQEGLSDLLTLPMLLLRFPEVVIRLEIDPKLGGSTEGIREGERGFCGHAALLIDDFVHLGMGPAQVSG